MSAILIQTNTHTHTDQNRNAYVVITQNTCAMPTLSDKNKKAKRLPALKKFAMCMYNIHEINK